MKRPDFAALIPEAKEQEKEVKEQLRHQPIMPIAHNINMTFIDGGSATLARTPQRCIALIKIAVVKTQSMKRAGQEVVSSLVSITKEKGGFVVRQQPITGNIPFNIEKIDAADLSLEYDEPSKLVDLIRAMMEFSVAQEQQGVTMRDGSLRTTEKFLMQLRLRKDLLCLAKTSTLESIPSGEGTWHASLDDEGKIHIEAIRLHTASGHVFLLESREAVNEELFAHLAALSNDAAFPGYPYPLLLADQLARVTNQERDTWRAMLAADKRLQTILSKEASAMNAHDVLEHILYGKPML